MRAPGLVKVSIRTKLILMVAGTLIVAQMISAFLIRRVVRDNILDQALTTVEILTTSIGHDVTYEAQRDPKSDGQKVVAKYMTYYRIISHMTIYNQRREGMASSDPTLITHHATDADVIEAIQRAKPTLHVSRSDLKDLGIRSVAPIFQGSHLVGAVAIDVSMQDVQETLNRLDRRIGLIMGLKLVLVCAALFVLLQRSILERLRRFMGVTEQIAAGNYDARVGDAQSDEIGQLALAFDRMTGDLQKSKREIESQNRHLEERVSEATEQLQLAYEDLKNAQSQLVTNEKMATLGVLVAGVAHEINTPAGAVLNVSRNLERQIETMPEQLGSLKHELEGSVDERVACLRALMASARTPRASASIKVQKEVEAILRDHGVEDPRARAASLCKLNFTDPAEVLRYVDCFRVASFFSFAETCASIAQGANISQTSAQKIAEIIRALKYYAYSDTERFEMVQVNDSIASALVLLDNHLKHKTAVHVDYDPELPRIPCTSELHQVWTNLVTNACDAIAERPAGAPAGEIRIATRCEGDSVIVSITDNGVGIPPEKRDRIFDPFFTTKDVGKGTGLGLCIVAGIVKKHHGSIRFESEPNRTTFLVSLPVREEATNGQLPLVGQRDGASKAA